MGDRLEDSLVENYFPAIFRSGLGAAGLLNMSVAGYYRLASAWTRCPPMGR